jgi:hypothetical protein
MNQVFGGSICGHYEHQYNVIGGRIVDLSHDAIDVGRITVGWVGYSLYPSQSIAYVMGFALF